MLQRLSASSGRVRISASGSECWIYLPSDVVLTICIVSLSNHGVDREVDAMFDVGTETLALPMSEKMKYEQGDEGDSFG